MSQKKYRLIWFQHFHKAAGSTIVEYANINNEKLYPNHLNGNPVEEDGTLINLDTFSPEELTLFIDKCEKNSITFVTTEWSAPDFDTLANDPRVVLITCIRDPLKRVVSNFYFDLYNSFTNSKKLENYVNSKGLTYTMDNYYCRILSRHDSNPNEIDEILYKKAKMNLTKFDCCVTVESGFSSLSKTLNWECPTIEKNKSGTNIRTYIRLLVKGQFKSIFMRLTFPKKSPSSDFCEEYKEKNIFDYKIFTDSLSKKNYKQGTYSW